MEQPPTFSEEQIAQVQQALVAHCEEMKDRIALVDPPLVQPQGDVTDVAGILDWRKRFDSKYAALYFPWVLVYDPLHLGREIVRAIPPSGHVGGVYARTDLDTGVHRAPANLLLLWAQGVTQDVDANMQGLLNPVGVNCLRAFSGRGLRVYGARTVSSDPAWRYVNVRRLLMMIEEGVEEAIHWAVFEPHTLGLRRTLKMCIEIFLEVLWEKGALVGATADEAFYVRCDDSNNLPSDTDNGRLFVDVGVAPTIPAEFVVFRIGRTEDELEVTEL